MQIQNPQQQIPVNPVQIPVQEQVFVPQQQIPVQMQNTVMPQQVVVQPVVAQPAVEQEWVFDKILKWIIDFVAKLSGQPAPTQNWGQIPGQMQNTVMPQQVVNQPIPQQNIAQQMGGLLWQLGTGLWNIVNQATQATQTYINEPVQIPNTVNTQQQILDQNYQQIPVQTQQVVAQPVIQPVIQPVVTEPIVTEPVVVQPMVTQPIVEQTIPQQEASQQ